MLQCLQGTEAVADDGDIMPFFGGPGTPLTSTAPSGKDTERHMADVVTFVAQDGIPDSHAGKIDFTTGTYCRAEAVVECDISLRGEFSSSMQDIVETHVLSMSMALHSNLPPLQQWAKGQGVALARHLAARARFDQMAWCAVGPV